MQVPRSDDRGLDRSLTIRSTVVAAFTALALVGCAAMLPGGGTPSGGGTAAGGEGTPTAPASATAADGEDGPGVTDDTVKVVVLAVDMGEVTSSLGFATAPPGDPAVQVQALEDWVNANGGIAGRQLEAIVRPYPAMADSPSTVEQFCNQVTQDDEAFAVVLTGQFLDNARPCYAQRETLMLDATLVSNDSVRFQELAPYLWSASYPVYDTFIEQMLANLDEQGFLDDAERLGVVVADNPVNRRVVESTVDPGLEALGVEPVTVWIDETDMGTLNMGLLDAVVTFRSRDVGHVTFLGGARMGPFFLTTAAGQQYSAKYAISSFDNPSFIVNNPTTVPPEVLPSITGVGFNAAQDVAESTLPLPAHDAEARCLELMNDAGETFETREHARFALVYCDAIFLLHAAAQDLGPTLNAQVWAEAASQLGDEFRPAGALDGATLIEGGPAVDAVYRSMNFDPSCTCFRYVDAGGRDASG